jgi:hypothetical protein
VTSQCASYSARNDWPDAAPPNLPTSSRADRDGWKASVKLLAGVWRILTPSSHATPSVLEMPSPRPFAGTHEPRLARRVLPLRPLRPCLDARESQSRQPAHGGYREGSEAAPVFAIGYGHRPSNHKRLRNGLAHRSRSKVKGNDVGVTNCPTTLPGTLCRATTLSTWPERPPPSALISKADLQHFIVHLRERGVKPVSRNTWIRALNAFCRWLHEQGEAAMLVKLAPHGQRNGSSARMMTRRCEPSSPTARRPSRTGLSRA